MQASKFSRVPVLALTATATDKVKTDVLSILGISKCPVFTVGLQLGPITSFVISYSWEYVHTSHAHVWLYMFVSTCSSCRYCVQVSFFRSNLVLSVVKKPTGRTPDGKPAELDALVKYIK